MSGNAGINGWGVENIYGLIVDYEFLPSSIYITVIPEADFYRGLRRLEGQSYWSHKPRFAFQELLYFIFFKEGNKKYNNWQSSANEDEIKRVLKQAVSKLHEMDTFLNSGGFKHLIYISPTREQVLNGKDKNENVQELLREYNIDVIYILDRINSMELTRKEKEKLYYDYVHLSKNGHELWAEIIGSDLSKLIER